LDKIEDAITKQQTTRLLVENTKQIDGVIKELDKRRIETLSGIETLTEENQTNVKVDEWIDWYKSLGDKINNLRKANLSIEEKNQFITGVVKSIEVIEKSGTEDELPIEYREPFVGDKLVWNNVKKKSLGYKLKNGRKKMTLNGVLTSKKKVRFSLGKSICVVKLSSLQLNNQPLIVVFKNIKKRSFHELLFLNLLWYQSSLLIRSNVHFTLCFY